MYLIYITFQTKKDAMEIASKLVKGQYISCANIYNNVTSVYEWNGNIENNEEVAMICKVADNKVDVVIKLVKESHSYDCPCVIAIKVEKGNEDFLKWVDNCGKIAY